MQMINLKLDIFKIKKSIFINCIKASVTFSRFSSIKVLYIYINSIREEFILYET